ncbi:hypothetical protein GBAR_LOCUS7506, partial [Geodia barretti]
GWRGGRGGGYNSFRGGGRGYRGRGGYQNKWGGRGGYNRDDGGYRGRGGFNRDRNTGDGYSNRGGGGRFYHGGGGRGRGGGGGYYERDSYDRHSRRDDNFSDEEGGSRTKDYEYRESRSGGYGGGEHKSQEHSRAKKYSSSPEYVKEEVRSSKYRKRSEGDEYQHHSGSEYHHGASHPESSSKWDSSPYRHQGGSPDGSYNRSRSRSRSPYTAAADYYSPPHDHYRSSSSRKTLGKRSGSYEHLDQYPAVQDTYSSNRPYERRADYSPEPAEPQYAEYRERDRMVKYGGIWPRVPAVGLATTSPQRGRAPRNRWNTKSARSRAAAAVEVATWLWMRKMSTAEAVIGPPTPGPMQSRESRASESTGGLPRRLGMPAPRPPTPTPRGQSIECGNLIGAQPPVRV